MGSDVLIDLVRTYNLPIDLSDLQSISEDEDQARLLAEWAKSHLTADTLLTRDELTSYATDQSNQAENGLC